MYHLTHRPNLVVKFFLHPNEHVLYIHVLDVTTLILKVLKLGRCIIHVYKFCANCIIGGWYNFEIVYSMGHSGCLCFTPFLNGGC